MPVKKVKKATKTSSNLAVDVYNIKGKVVDKVILPSPLFKAKINPVLMAQAVRVYLANQRQGTASTKTRGEVRGSTRKIYRQKHTGRARHGGIRAPIFVGGGIVFGPKPRDFSLKLPKKMKRKALISALTSKLKEQAIKVITGLEKIPPRTKTMSELLNKIVGEQNKRRKILLIIPGKIKNVYQVARNIEGVVICPVNLLNTYEVLNNNVLLLMKESISAMEKIYGLK